MEQKTFNLADAVQAGGRYFASAVKSVFSTYWLVVVVLSVVMAIISRMGIKATASASFAQAMERSDPGAMLTAFILACIQVALLFLFLTYAAAGTYAQASGVPSQGYAFKMGTGDTPLFGVTVEQSMMTRTSFKRLLALWPFLVAVLVYAPVGALSMQITLSGFSGADVTAAKLTRLILQLIALFFFLWYMAKVSRHYLFRAAVITETKAADPEEIAAYLPGRFPANLRSAGYWRCAGLILAAWFPVWAVGWLLGKIYAALDVFETGFVALLISNLVMFMAWALALTFLSGAQAYIRGVGAVVPVATPEEG
ncbi:hypothetical protein [Actibacterium sp. D379-3]